MWGVNRKKIGLVRSLLIVLVVATLVLTGVWWFWWRSPASVLELGNTKVNVEVVRGEEEQAAGLSNRESLAKGTGMLFVYEGPNSPGIWMKEMRFNIDIIWIDENSVVVGTESDVSPDTYPQIYYPPKPVRFILEVPAGFVYEHNIESGMKAQLPAL